MDRTYRNGAERRDHWQYMAHCAEHKTKEDVPVTILETGTELYGIVFQSESDGNWRWAVMERCYDVPEYETGDMGDIKIAGLLSASDGKLSAFADCLKELQAQGEFRKESKEIIDGLLGIGDALRDDKTRSVIAEEVAKQAGFASAAEAEAFQEDADRTVILDAARERGA